jgi:hypothetical protein
LKLASSIHIVVVSTPGAWGVVDGLVVDAVTKRPIEGALVGASSPQLENYGCFVTGDDGVFRIVDLAPGEYAFGVEGYGYVAVCARVHVGDDVTARVIAELAVDPSPKETPLQVDVGAKAR